MKEVVIVSPVRTPVGAHGGAASCERQTHVTLLVAQTPSAFHGKL